MLSEAVPHDFVMQACTVSITEGTYKGFKSIVMESEQIRLETVPPLE
ncbi:hypothetical protein [Paenibacillus donghaensis]|nr:hypothetical protein [Paenibacillus donghaensis]